MFRNIALLTHFLRQRFLTLQNKSAAATHKQLCAVYGTMLMSSGLVDRWRRLFRDGRIQVEDEKHSGRPHGSIIEENVATVRSLLEQDYRLTLARLFFFNEWTTRPWQSNYWTYCKRCFAFLKNFLSLGVPFANWRTQKEVFRYRFGIPHALP